MDIMSNTKISVTQYAKSRGISRQAVLKQIKKGKNLPTIIKYEMIGTTYILYTTKNDN
jgi:predicted DNA-binding protein YlxM (UPF0122 family)